MYAVTKYYGGFNMSGIEKVERCISLNDIDHVPFIISKSYYNILCISSRNLVAVRYYWN
jgi:hypothetical protein